MSNPNRDVVVIGSGGAGLFAACTVDRDAQVAVLEAADLLGGTTALSGGQLWIPNSGPMKRAGFDE